ncbi:DEAD/DEAH box helicase [Nanoarchaeota archaeon]
MTFKIFELKEEIIQALKEDGIVDPTEIQNLVIPHVLEGRDVIGMSKTGSGKTAAFGVPIINNIKPGQGLQVMILAPTRELVIQIKKELDKFSKHVHCRMVDVYGGVAYGPQIEGMAKSEILVATTGRLVDHVKRGNVDFSNLNCVVLDEADKMVEMGFIEDIEFLLSKIAKEKQVLLFGATLSHEINKIKREHMNDPFTAKAELDVKEEYLEQYYVNVQPHEKFSYLAHLLKTEDIDRAIVFCTTRSQVEVVADNLKKAGIKVAALHGKLTQNKRMKMVENFNKDRPSILIASSVAARGLDIQNVSHIFNYGLSRDPQEYVHRVGRTARAGKTGIAITLLEPRDYDVFTQIKSNYREMNIVCIEQEEFERVKFDNSMAQQGRRNFRRPSNYRRGPSNRGRGSSNRGQGSSNRGQGSGSRSPGSSNRSSSGGSPGSGNRSYKPNPRSSTRQQQRNRSRVRRKDS